jgi:hypothetical protein
MSFLTPLFFLGSLAVALPVIFHLIRRSTRNRTVFSSLLFLEPTPPRLSRRSRLEHLLLLLLRCVVICLMALAFARPFFNKPLSALPASVPRRMLVLVDTSASMRRPNLWTDARNKVQSLLAETSPFDQLAVFTFDRQAQPLVTFEQWKTMPASERAALVSAKLAAISPGWSSTHVGNALLTAAEALADPNSSAPSGPAQLYLITDLQEGSRLGGLQGYEWPKNLSVSVEVLKPKQVGNASIQSMTDSADSTSQDKAGVRLRVSNSADAPREQFNVGWGNPSGSTFVDKPATVYVPPGQSRIVQLPLTTNVTGANRVLLQGDEQDFDNSQYILPLRASQVDVLYLGVDTALDPKAPLYFLQRAFQQTRQQTVRVIARTPTDPVQPGELQSAALLVVADPLSPDNARALHQQVTAGKTALVCLKSPSVAPSVAGLLGIENLAVEEANADRYAMLADIDFRHPLFASFADPRFSDFTKIHFWKHRHLDASQIPAAHVVAKFDNGDPAVLDVPVGKGRVLILTSGWQPEDSQLALSSKFVPLLYAVLDQTGAAQRPPQQFNVGDVIPLVSSSAPVTPAPDSVLRVRLPDGSEIKLPPGETNFSQTSMPGVYTVISSEPPREFAVNLEPSESATAPLSTDELERLGVPLSHGVLSTVNERQRQVRLQTAEMERQQKLWRWIIAATLCMLLFETWLAGRTARSRPAQAQLGQEGAT